MKTVLRLCVSVALAGIALLGQTKPKDIDGWGKIKWGMTIAEARSAYGMSKSGKNEEQRVFLEQKIKVGDIDLSVEIAAKNNRIAKVELSDLPAGSSDFDKIKTLLIQKYGTPASQESKIADFGVHATALWTFPSTSIFLEGRGGDVVFLSYTATDKKALDVL